MTDDNWAAEGTKRPAPSAAWNTAQLKSFAFGEYTKRGVIEHLNRYGFRVEAKQAALGGTFAAATWTGSDGTQGRLQIHRSSERLALLHLSNALADIWGDRRPTDEWEELASRALPPFPGEEERPVPGEPVAGSTTAASKDHAASDARHGPIYDRDWRMEELLREREQRKANQESWTAIARSPAMHPVVGQAILAALGPPDRMAAETLTAGMEAARVTPTAAGETAVYRLPPFVPGPDGPTPDDAATYVEAMLRSAFFEAQRMVLVGYDEWLGRTERHSTDEAERQAANERIREQARQNRTLPQ